MKYLNGWTQMTVFWWSLTFPLTPPSGQDHCLWPNSDIYIWLSWTLCSVTVKELMSHPFYLFIRCFCTQISFDCDSCLFSNCIDTCHINWQLCYDRFPSLWSSSHTMQLLLFLFESFLQLLCVCRAYCEMTRHTQDKRRLSSMREG